MFESILIHQTFRDCVFNQYTHFDTPDVTANYGMPLDFVAFLGILHSFTYLVASHLLQVIQNFEEKSFSSYGIYITQ